VYGGPDHNHNHHIRSIESNQERTGSPGTGEEEGLRSRNQAEEQQRGRHGEEEGSHFG
jgi:hypothetical protein